MPKEQTPQDHTNELQESPEAAAKRFAAANIELEAQLADRDTAIKGHVAMIAAFDERVTTQARLIESLEGAVKEREEEIANLEEALTGPEANVSAAAVISEPFDLGLVKVNDDLERAIHDDPWMHAETINFRHDSGYSESMKLRAVASVERALTIERIGHRFENLPPFSPGNRLLVIVGLLGPAQAQGE